MTPEVRAAMTQAAVTAAKAISYQGAGTIEFIVDGTGDLRTDGFWFMEMNTRLQVEHPVTEAITGTDLVEWQLRVASGDPLPLIQDELPLMGHAFEARLYAEDPGKDFLPATGKIDHISFGHGRIDTGVRTGDEISPFYDPMIAKVITHGKTRAEALTSLQSALADIHVAGPTTNVGFLGALARHDGFSKGEVDTGLIARDLDALIARPAPNDICVAIAALALSGIDITATYVGWRHWAAASHHLTLHHEGTEIAVILSPIPGTIRVTGNEIDLTLTDIELTSDHLSARHNGHQFTAKVHTTILAMGSKTSVHLEGITHVFTVPNPLNVAAIVVGSANDVKAPMTGVVRSVVATPGQSVTQGDALVVLEAMKMEHSLTAPRDGEIEEITCATGDQVSDGTILVRLKAKDDG